MHPRDFAKLTKEEILKAFVEARFSLCDLDDEAIIAARDQLGHGQVDYLFEAYRRAGRMLPLALVQQLLNREEWSWRYTAWQALRTFDYGTLPDSLVTIARHRRVSVEAELQYSRDVFTKYSIGNGFK